MAFNDGYGVKGKFTSNTGKKAAQQNKIKESTRRQKAETFRADEKKSLTKSIGTAGPKVRPDGTVKDDKPTAAQKIAFKKQEDPYRTKSPGTVGDKYYKNPEGTGTGQGGSGIPKNTTKQTSGAVTTATPPVERPESIQPTVTSPVVSTDSNTSQSSQSSLSPLSPTETAEVFTPTYTFLEEDDVVRTGRGKEIQRGIGVGLLTLSLKPSVNLFNRSKPFFDGMELKGEVKF